MPRANRGLLIAGLAVAVALSWPAWSQAPDAQRSPASDAQRNTVMRMRQRLIDIYQADLTKCAADDKAACDEAKTLYGSLKDIDSQIVELGWGG